MQNNYQPHMAQLTRKWVASCEQCVGEVKNGNKLTRPSVHKPSKHVTGSENAMHFHLDPDFPQSCSYENI